MVLTVWETFLVRSFSPPILPPFVSLPPPPPPPPSAPPSFPTFFSLSYPSPSPSLPHALNPPFPPPPPQRSRNVTEMWGLPVAISITLPRYCGGAGEVMSGLLLHPSWLSILLSVPSRGRGGNEGKSVP